MNTQKTFMLTTHTAIVLGQPSNTPADMEPLNLYLV